MKTLKILTFCLAMAGFTLNSSAQLNEIDFLKGGLADAQVLFQEYLTPYANAFGANLNAGWYNTGKPHSTLGFDFTITFNAAWAPPFAKSFDLSTLGLSGTVTGDPVTPTIAGKRSTDTRLLYTVENPVSPGTDITLADYNMPGGTGINVIPLPMAQLGIGLPLGTDVSVRYLPSLDFGKYGSIGLWGVGLKHSILQHIPVLKRVPVIDASLQGGFTRLNTFANINYGPDDLLGTNLTTNTDPKKWDNQKITLGVDAWTVNLVISQTLPVVTFYQAIGYSNTKTNVALTGNFPYNSVQPDGSLVVTDDDFYTDPFDVEIQNSKDLRLNAGMRIKLGVLTIHADYTKANYSVVTAGIGISFR